MTHPYRGGPIRRTTWTVKRYAHEYNDETEERHQDPNGPLIASLTENDLHAPALDIDFPVQVQRLGYRSRILLANPRPVDTFAWREMLKSLSRSGLMSMEWVRKELDWIGRNDDLLKTMPMMPPLIIAAEVKVHPSTTPGHSHLYIEQEIPWEAYRMVLHQLALAGIIEVAYAKVSIAREMTMLFRPGYPNPKKKKGGFLAQIFS